MDKIKANSRALWIIFAAAVVLAVVVCIAFRNKPPEPGLVLVDSYAEDTPCLAIMPECGTCFGEIIDHECWVNPDKLTESQRHTMGFK